MKEATEYLKKLKRIQSVEEGKKVEEDILYLPSNIDLTVDENSNVKTMQKIY